MSKLFILITSLLHLCNFAQGQVHRTGLACTHFHNASDVNAGTFADARIAASNVTQHQASLSIAESQVPNLVTDLAAKAPLASPTFTGTPAAPSAATGTNTTQLATTAFVQTASNYGSYQTILEASGSHTAAKVAGTYALGDGYPAAVSGTGTLDPIKTIFIAVADYPSVDGKAAKLRLRVQLYVNDVAPTGNFTFGLYPITRPATSGGAGLDIYTLGTVVTSSTVLFTTPAADGLLNGASADFALPSDGHYVIGFVSTATVATSSHLHMSASLQKRNN
jgi:hypothetical protein